MKSCSDDDSEYCSLSESEEENKSDGNHLSVEKSVKTEIMKEGMFYILFICQTM